MLKVNDDEKASISLKRILGICLIFLFISGICVFAANKQVKNVKGLADYKKENNMNFDIEIDGGVNADNLHRPLEAGANIIVAGSAIYGKEDIPAEIKKFKEIMDRYED